MSFESNIDPAWLEAQYLLWKGDPEEVSPEWRAFFRGYELGRPAPGEELPTPDRTLKESTVQSLIYRYRDIGHLLACTDPLTPCRTDHPLLSLEAFGLEESDLEEVFHPRRFEKPSATLREIVEVLRETYCRSIGVEFMHIQEPGERQWLMERMEPVRNRARVSRRDKLEILRKLQEAGLFEAFLHRRFLGQKRFSLEGGETLIPVLDHLVKQAAQMGIRDIVLGTSHRGRINILANIFDKPLENIFAEFEDNIEFGFVGEGDVKYHQGFSTDKVPVEGRPIHLTMASNPSHLEAVDPVVEGKTRARQDALGAGGEKVVLPLLIHGDAAFAGQGIVAETLNLSQLEGYRTGGTLHVVLNNQIGFTTLPGDARSTRYATDVAKMLMVPIFHVHGEDPEAALFASGLALEYRQTFGRDVILEIICYRRQGHNEGDEPYFTQPLMYENIKNRPPVHRIYADRLVEEGLDRGELDAMEKEIDTRLEAALQQPPRDTPHGFKGEWSGIEREFRRVRLNTGVAGERMRALAEKFTAIPEGFTPHPKVEAYLRKHREAIEAGLGIDWAGAEALALATLLSEGVNIRFSGQDSRRGTFSQRHSTLFDIRTGKSFIPLSKVAEKGATFNIFDSMLSEAAVLGFENGYALQSPHSLTVWEAQFGDFANGAQVIIDQFIVSSKTKWDRVSGLVMLLPHGYEGQGPEHSSARIERYLQACAGDNIQVTYPSTPAQYFHLLRRQVLQPFRRPLVVFTPKSLLRHPSCVSDLAEFEEGRFREVLPAATEPDKVRTVLFCCGKLFYELEEKRAGDERKDVAIIRVEQLYPLHTGLLREALAPLGRAERFVWAQEEPRNAGAWTFLRPHLAELLGKEPEYVGRPESATTAVGSHRIHKIEQEEILRAAFG